MSEEILFSETQRFRKAWFLTLILFVNAIFIYGFIQQVVLGKPIGTMHLDNAFFWILITINILTTLFLLMIRLDTVIKKDALYVRFFPIHRHYKKYEWNQLSEIYVRKYHPIGEYGGWGYRITIGGGKAYNISGNMGIQLVMPDNAKLLIGTKKPEEVTEALKRIDPLEK